MNLINLGIYGNSFKKAIHLKHLLIEPFQVCSSVLVLLLGDGKRLDEYLIIWDTCVKMDNELCINIIKANNRVKLQVMIPYLDEYVEYG